MADENKLNIKFKSESRAAKELLSKGINDLKNIEKAQKDGDSRWFFPNGIELISIKVTVSKIDVEFKVAGAKGISDLLNSEEIELGLPVG